MCKVNPALEELAEIESIKRANELLDMISLTAEERDFYEAKLKWLRDEEAAIKTALNKGRKEGREEGREEKAIEIAKNLLGVLEDKVISHITGLSEEKIREMRKV